VSDEDYARDVWESHRKIARQSIPKVREEWQRRLDEIEQKKVKQ